MPRKPVEDRILISKQTKLQVFSDCGRICSHCGRKLKFEKDFTLEHVIPLSKGGTNDLRNLVALCENCNKEKANDVIPPMEYFEFLPKEKRKELQKMFNEYIRTQDWLDYDNLFMTDWFSVTPNRVIVLPKTGKTMFIPMPLKVRRIREQYAMDLLQDFKQYLSKDDQNDIVVPWAHLDEPYYEVTMDGKRLMFFSAYIMRDQRGIGDEQWDYMLQMDYFIDPGVKYNPRTAAATLYNVINAILEKARETLLNGSQGTVIPVRIRSPKSGPMVRDVAAFFSYIHHDAVEVFHIGHEDHDGLITAVNFLMFQGNSSELKAMMRNRGSTDLAGLSKALSEESTQESIRRRLASSLKMRRYTPRD